MKIKLLILALLLGSSVMAQKKPSALFKLSGPSSVMFMSDAIDSTLRVVDTTFTASDNKAFRTVKTEFKDMRGRLMETRVTECWDDKLRRWSFWSGTMEPVKNLYISRSNNYFLIPTNK